MSIARMVKNGPHNEVFFVGGGGEVKLLYGANASYFINQSPYYFIFARNNTLFPDHRLDHQGPQFDEHFECKTYLTPYLTHIEGTKSKKQFICIVI